MGLREELLWPWEGLVGIVVEAERFWGGIVGRFRERFWLTGLS